MKKEDAMNLIESGANLTFLNLNNIIITSSTSRCQ